MLDWLFQHWTEALFTGLITVIGILLRRMTNRVKHEVGRQQSIENGVKALLYDRILRAYYYYKDKGYITLHELENVDNMCDEYQNLGGRSGVTKLAQALRQLPLQEEWRCSRELDKQ